MTAEIPQYQPFYLDSLHALRDEIARLGLRIPVEEDAAILAEPIVVGGRTISNRFCAQPISGWDADPDGAPGELTLRRYRRYAEGGFGLIWFESTVPGATGEPGRLLLNDSTRAAFRAMTDSVRQAAPAIRSSIASTPSIQSSAAPTLLLQLNSPKFTSLESVTDEAVARHRDELIQAAALAARAGFDGVDIQCSHGSLAGARLSAFHRAGTYGGSFENRTRFLHEVLSGIRAHAPTLLLAVRLCAFDARRHGFGVSATDYRKPDTTEPSRLAQLLQGAGVAFLNVTSASPNLRLPTAQRALQPLSDFDNPHEHPLMTLDRQLSLAQTLREAAPGLAVVGSGFSWLRQFVPNIAAGAIRAGMIDIAGLGRAALAHPNGPADFLAGCSWAPESSCMVCFACSALHAESEPVGCVIRDPEVYGPLYRDLRRFDSDHLLAGAARCHLCEAAPCISASPTRTNIPAFIDAFRKGDEGKAYEIIRSHDVLPELTSRLSPAWLESEGACIETTLSGVSVPISDLQYAVSWRARERSETGVRIPEHSTGRRIAIVGGGPAGISAAVRLLEFGHSVDLYESTDRLGGAPRRAIPQSRAPDVVCEITAILRPALMKGARASRPQPSEPAMEGQSKIAEPDDAPDGKNRNYGSETEEANGCRLKFHFGFALGKNLNLADLRASHNAVLLAAGVWQERTIGAPPSTQISGVVGALAFLESAKLKDKREGDLPQMTAERWRDKFTSPSGPLREVGRDENFSQEKADEEIRRFCAQYSETQNKVAAFAASLAKAALIPIPDRVAILAGGDSAMDAARVAQANGAKEIFIIFGGPLSAMHWHMPASWFATPGVHAMMSWAPFGYEKDSEGRVTGVRIRHAELKQEAVLHVDLIIEAMGLEIADSLRKALAGLPFNLEGRIPVAEGGRTSWDGVYAAGALVNGGASVSQCVAEGMAAAVAIHNDLAKFPARS